MQKYQIFISYRRDGGEMLGQLLHDRLSQMGYDVFFDVESLRSGKFNDELYRVMEECNDVIVVLPPNALARCEESEDWVRKEISYCISKKKNIVPIMMRGFEFPEVLPSDIDELRNYNGITANEISSFPWVLEKLTGKFLHSKPSNKNINYKSSTEKGGERFNLFNCIQQLMVICVLGLPYVTQWMHLKFDWLPDGIERVVNAYVNFDLKWLTLILAFEFYLIYRFGIKNDYEYIQKKYKEKNIDENILNCTFDEFITTLLSKDYIASIAKGNQVIPTIDENYSEYTCFKNVEVGSLNGDLIDYFYIDFSKLPNPKSISVLYLDKQTGKQRAINFLSKQKFVYLDEKEDILQFKKNDLTVKLAYTEAGMTMLACEITRSEELSQIREKTYEKWNNSFVRETRLGTKARVDAIKRAFKFLENKYLSLDKKKQNLVLRWSTFALVILFIICVILLTVTFQNCDLIKAGKTFLE